MSSDESPTLSDLVAHSAPEGGGEEQSLEDHLRGVAEKAAGFAEALDAAEVARWLGWWHDAGKVHGDVQAYLRGRGESKDHSSVGMLKGREAATPAPGLCCAGHHGGLFDTDDFEGRCQRAERRTHVPEALERAERLLAPVAKGDMNAAPTLEGPREEQAMQLEMWTRFVHSALVDADFLDTGPRASAMRAASRCVRFWRRSKRSAKCGAPGRTERKKRASRGEEKLGLSSSHMYSAGCVCDCVV